MGKKLVPVIAILLMFVPVASFALGLGPITMRSALNQPLLAEIELDNLKPGDLDGLVVRLGSEEDFGRLDVIYQSFLKSIKFSIDFRNDGSAYVKLTTKKAITEPFIEFLVEAKYARGRSVKPYTVLVDPPVLTAEAPAPVQQAETSPVFSQPKPRQAQRRPNRPNTNLQTPKSVAKRQQSRTPSISAPARDFTTGDDGSLTYGKVQRGETLSQIARSMREDAVIPVSTQQMMLALLKNNPSAFVEGNINQLKAGYVLRIEDTAVLDELTQSEAVREVRRQTQEWLTRRGDGRLVRQADASEFADERGSGSSNFNEQLAEEPEVSDSAQLKLVAPGKEGLGAGAGVDSGSNQQIREELLLANEALQANRQESDELKGKLSDLEEQMTSMQRLIMLKDEELLTLQNELGKEPQAETNTPLSEAETNKLVEDNAAAVTEEKREPLAQEEAGFLSDTLLLILAVLLVIGMVVALVIRRRKMQQGFEESILNVGMSATVGSSAAAVSTPMSQPQESGIVSDFAMSDMSGIQSDTTEVDPISEADVYLAYGRHQQAEDILKQAIESDPSRPELRSKLLEVYHGSNNKGAFESQAQQLYESIGGDESNEHWARAASMGVELCPESPLFGGAGTLEEQTMLQPPTSDVGGMTADEEDLLDFEFDDEPTEMVSSAQPAAEDSDIDDDSLLDFDVNALDFNLDEDLQDTALSDLDALDNSSSDDNALDFDIPSSTSESSDNSTLEFTNASADDEMNLSLDALDLDDSTGFESEVHDELAGSESLPDEGLNLSLVDESAGGEEESMFDSFDNEVGETELGDDIFANVDEIGTKLDLAKAYVDMGDSDGARSILDEVIEEGDDTQKQQAEELLQQMG